MQPIAAWLVARPERAVLVLIATFLTPITQLIGNAILVLLVLSRGFRAAAVAAGFALGAILLLALVRNVGVAQVLQVGLTIWLPGIVLALLLKRMRSLTLLLQITVLVAFAVVIGMQIVLGDPASYWRAILEAEAGLWREAGFQTQSDLFLQLIPFAGQMSGIVVSIGWLLLVGALLLGYAAYLSLPDGRQFGRFADLNLGRVLAIALALVSVAATLTGTLWLQNSAFVLFVIFWLQGMAMLHWLRRQGRLPTLGLASIYVLTILLSPFVVPAVGVIGYTDAWFDYRLRIAKK